MGIVRRLVLRLLINALGLYLAVQFVRGIHSAGSWPTFLAMAFILGLANALVRPLLTFLSFPLILLSLGLFTLVINALMLWLAGAIGAHLGLAFSVDNFRSAFLGALIVGAVNWLLSIFVGDHRHHRR